MPEALKSRISKESRRVGFIVSPRKLPIDGSRWGRRFRLPTAGSIECSHVTTPAPPAQNKFTRFCFSGIGCILKVRGEDHRKILRAGRSEEHTSALQSLRHLV